MDIYLVLKPIFSKELNVLAYEILYKKNQLLLEEDLDDLYAKHLIDSILTYGLEKLTSGKPAYINFSKNLILKEIPTLLPNTNIVVGIDDDLGTDASSIEIIKSLKSKNYKMSFSKDYILPEYAGYHPYIDIIKTDFKYLDDNFIESIKRTPSIKAKLLCENISTAEDFNVAKMKNFDLYQGNFIIEPQILTIKDISPLKVNFIELLNKVNNPDINFDDIASIISRDVSLTFKLLRLVNSVGFGLVHKIESIKQASVMLGASELKKWVAFFAINNICDDKPDELMRTSLIRAKFLEKLGSNTYLKARGSDLFLVGLFSLLDVMFGRPLDEVLLEIKISDDVKNCLLNQQSIFADIFNLSIAYEKCDWDSIDVFTAKVGLTEEFVMKCYLDATTWCNKILNDSFEILE